MKKILLATTFMALASTAFAADFDNTGVDLKFTSGNLQFNANTVDGELTSIGTGVTVLQGELAGFRTGVDAKVAYNLNEETIAASAAYTAAKEFGAVNLDASLKAVYTVNDNGGEGVVTAEPSVTVGYVFANKAAAFTEVGYAWNVSDSWSKEGGYAKVGIDYAVSETVSLKPSLVRTFDTGADETNANLEVALAF